MLNVESEWAGKNRYMFQFNGDGTLIYAKLVSVGGEGLWIENPNWKTIPQSTGIEETHSLMFLVPWSRLVSVGVFPDRKFDTDAPVQEKFTQTIGFQGP